jgi:hypothetical protein
MFQPPEDLIREWCKDRMPADAAEAAFYLAQQAAQWGADQELEACCEWLGDAPVVYNDNDDLHPGSYLRDARRPESPSLKEQALKGFYTMSQFVLDEWSGCSDYKVYKEITDTVLRALEQLND